MSSLKQQQQKLSQLQSQLAKKSVRTGRSRSRSRSRDRKEKANSKQRRKTPQKGGQKIANFKIGSGSKWWDKQKIADLDLSKARACLDRKRDLDVKMNGCDHNCPVVQDYDPSDPLNRLKKTFGLRCTRCGKQVYHLTTSLVEDAKTKKQTQIRVYATVEKNDEKAVIMENPATLKDLYDLVCKEFEMAKSAMRAGLGNKPIKLRLSAAFLVTTTVTTGVTNTVTIGGNTAAICPADSSEYSAIAGIFDEMKLLGGHVDFLYKNPLISDLTTAVVVNNMPAIGFDPDNGTAQTSTEAICRYAQHETLSPMFLNTAQLCCPGGGSKHHFKFRVPPGVMNGGGATPSVIGDQWQATVGTPLPSGFIVFYHVGQVVTAMTTGAGVLYYDCEFRCRE